MQKAVCASLALLVCAILAACGPSGPTAIPTRGAPAATGRAPAATATAPAATATVPAAAAAVDIPAIVSALSPVVSGQGAAGAAAYDAGSPGPHRVLLLTQQGAYDVWNDLLPPGWRPSSVGEVELVAVLARREILLGTHSYSPQKAGEPDVAVGRYRYECDVELREAHTGRLLAAETWSGTDPIPFPPTTWVTRLEGSGIEYVTLEAWLSPMVNQAGLWTQARTLEGPPGHGGSLTYSPDGRMLAGGLSDGTSGTIVVWDTAGWTLWQTLPVGSGVSGVAFSPDGRSLASASPDGTIAIWDLGGSGQSRTVVAPDPSVRSWWSSVAFSPDGRVLAAGAADGRVVLWDPASGAVVRALRGAGDTGAQQVAFSADGKILVSGSSYGVMVWDAAGGQVLRRIEGSAGGVVAISPDGRTLAVSELATIALWDIGSGTKVGSLADVAPPVLGLAFSPDGRILASGSDYDTAFLWDTAGGAKLQSLTGHWVAFSPDGQTLAAGSPDGKVQIWAAP